MDEHPRKVRAVRFQPLPDDGTGQVLEIEQKAIGRFKSATVGQLVSTAQARAEPNAELTLAVAGIAVQQPKSAKANVGIPEELKAGQ